MLTKKIEQLLNIFWFIYAFIIFIIWVSVTLLKYTPALFIISIVLGIIMYILKLIYIDKINSIKEFTYTTILKHLLLYFLFFLFSCIIVILFWKLCIYFNIYNMLFTTPDSFYIPMRRLILGFTTIHYIAWNPFIEHLKFTNKVDPREITFIIISLILSSVNIMYSTMFTIIVLISSMPIFFKNYWINFKNKMFTKTDTINKMSLSILTVIFIPLWYNDLDSFFKKFNNIIINLTGKETQENISKQASNSTSSSSSAMVENSSSSSSSSSNTNDDDNSQTSSPDATGLLLFGWTGAAAGATRSYRSHYTGYQHSQVKYKSAVADLQMAQANKLKAVADIELAKTHKEKEIAEAMFQAAKTKESAAQSEIDYVLKKHPPFERSRFGDGQFFDRTFGWSASTRVKCYRTYHNYGLPGTRMLIGGTMGAAGGGWVFCTYNSSIDYKQAWKDIRENKFPFNQWINK